MLTKKSVFDLKFYRWSVRHSLPYALLTAVILYLSTFVLFLIYSNEFSYSGGSMNCLPTALIGATGNVSVYAIPVILGIIIFDFLHKKNSSDFILSVPSKRVAMYLSGYAAGATMIFVILLLNTVLTAFCVNMCRGSVADVAFGSYIVSFFFNFVGSLEVLAITALAATLTGSGTSQTILSYIILFLPAFAANFFQLTNFGDTYFNVDPYYGEITLYPGIDFSSYMFIPDIGSSWLTNFFNLILENDVADFFGTYTYFASARGFCFTLFLTAILLGVGAFLFKKYRAENCGLPFAYKPVAYIVYAGVLFPFLSVFFLFMFEDGFSGTLFMVIMLLIFIGFSIMSLCINRGFSGYGKALLTLLCACVFCLGTAKIVDFKIDENEKGVDIYVNEISSVTLYVPPVNMVSMESMGENVRENYFKVRIDDPKILSLFNGDLNSDNRFYYDLVLRDGKKMTIRTRLPAGFENAVFDYIDSTPELKKKLIVSGGMDHFISAYTRINAYYYDSENRNYTKITDRTAIEKMISDNENKLLTMPVKDALNDVRWNSARFYATSAFVSDSYYDYDRYGGSFFAPFIEKGTVTISVPVVKYCKGQYFVSYITLENDSEFFKSSVADIQKEALYDLENNVPYRSWVNVGGAFRIDEEQYLNLSGAVNAMAYMIPDKLREAMKNAAKNTEVDDNSVLVYYTKNMSRDGRALEGKVFMDIERDIAPLLDDLYKAYRSELDRIKQSDYQFMMRYGMLLDGVVYCDTGTFDGYINFPNVIEELIEKFDEIKQINTRKYTPETVPSEMYSVTLGNQLGDYYYYKGFPLSGWMMTFYVDPSFEKTLDIVFDYYEKRYEKIAPDTINGYNFSGTTITDRKSMDYFSEIMKMTFFDEFSNGNFLDYTSEEEYKFKIGYSKGYDGYRSAYPSTFIDAIISNSQNTFSVILPCTPKLKQILERSGYEFDLQTDYDKLIYGYHGVPIAIEDAVAEEFD